MEKITRKILLMKFTLYIYCFSITCIMLNDVVFLKKSNQFDIKNTVIFISLCIIFSLIGYLQNKYIKYAEKTMTINFMKKTIKYHLRDIDVECVEFKKIKYMPDQIIAYIFTKEELKRFELSLRLINEEFTEFEIKKHMKVTMEKENDCILYKMKFF